MLSLNQTVVLNALVSSPETTSDADKEGVRTTYAAHSVETFKHGYDGSWTIYAGTWQPSESAMAVLPRNGRGSWSGLHKTNIGRGLTGLMNKGYLRQERILESHGRSRFTVTEAGFTALRATEPSLLAKMTERFRSRAKVEVEANPLRPLAHETAEAANVARKAWRGFVEEHNLGDYAGDLHGAGTKKLLESAELRAEALPLVTADLSAHALADEARWAANKAESAADADAREALVFVRAGRAQSAGEYIDPPVVAADSPGAPVEVYGGNTA